MLNLLVWRYDRKKCNFCGFSDYFSIIEIDKTPLSVQNFHSSIKALKKQSIKSLNIALCNNCLLISNIGYNNNDDSLYNDNYYYAPSEISEVEKEFQFKLAKQINNHINLKKKTILEIGCGDGFFLNQLTKYAIHGIGYDPSAACDRAMKYEKLDIYKEIFLPNKSSFNNADFFVLRHILEHLENPTKFLTSLANNNSSNTSSQYLYIEVPNAKFCMENNMYFDFYYDHIFYFNKFTLSKILSNSGWSPLYNIFGDDNEFLGIVSKKKQSKIIDELHYPFDSKYIPLAKRFKKGFNFWKEKLLEILSEINNSKKTFAIWGTGARGVSLLSNIDLNIYKPSYFIDSDPNKIGLFPPVGNEKIVSPDYIEKNPVDYILITSFTFFDEISNSLNNYKNDGGRLIKIYPTPETI